ncbi:MAG: DNA primase [Candidatus Omnitrophica bacterium]|nr:DNA primase [Candidatus Omnitrophota bacterium]
MIPQEFIDEVQNRTDIVEVVSQYIPLKRAGRNYKAVCPFHNEKTPSFFVNPQKQIFHCFGCGEGGGAVQFLMQYEKVGFVEAMEILAQRLGMTVPTEKGVKHARKAVLYDIMYEAARFYHEQLTQHQDVRRYLRHRGVGERTIETFQLGYAPGEAVLTASLRKKGFSLEMIEKVSLCQFARGRYRDMFRDRVMFPVRDARGRVVGFGGRLWRKDSFGPKYINSVENVLYQKRVHLFGLHVAKEHITAQDSVIVSEGYLDMISPFMRGIKNIVASLGTALTHEQVRLLKRYASEFILLFDSDSAGKNAAMRAIDVLLEHELQISIVVLPPGADPDSLVRQEGREGFSRLLEGKRGFFPYKMECLKEQWDMQSVHGKSRIVHEMLASLHRIPSEVEKHEYMKKLAAEAMVREEVIFAEYAQKYGRGRQAAASKPDSQDIPFSLTEKILLKCVCMNPQAGEMLCRNVRSDDFSYPLARRAVEKLCEQKSVRGAPFSDLLSKMGEREISGFLSGIVCDDTIPYNKELFRESMEKLRQKRIKKMKAEMKAKIQDAERRGDHEMVRTLMNNYGKISGVSNG